MTCTFAVQRQVYGRREIACGSGDAVPLTAAETGSVILVASVRPCHLWFPRTSSGTIGIGLVLLVRTKAPFAPLQ